MLAAFFTSALALTLNVPTPPPLVQPAPQQRSLATTVLLADGVPEQSLLFPTTGALADGKLLKETKNGDVYSGELDLGDMLDTIPTSDLDLNGEKGMKRDAQGIQREHSLNTHFDYGPFINCRISG